MNESLESPDRPADGLFSRLLAGGATAWHVKPATLLGLLALPFLIVAFGAITAAAGKEAFKWFAAEDGVAESLQVLFFSLALLLSAAVSRLWLKRGEKLICVLYLILTCGFVFLVGEEISWGQRIGGWSTPDEMAAINQQGETNLHNIRGVHDTFKWIQLLVGAYGTLLPLALLWKRPNGAWLPKLAAAVVPHYTLIVFFAPMFLWKLFRNLYGEIPGYSFVLAEFNEVIELVLAVGFFLFVLLQWRILTQASDSADRSEPVASAMPDRIPQNSAAGTTAEH